MSILGKVLLEYKADTSQAKAEIRSLAGAQKSAAEAELKNLEAKNKGYDNQIKMLGKVTMAFGAIAVAGKIAFDAIEFSGRRADLQAAAGAVSIDRLRKATLGLRTDTQLLELASKLNHSALKLTADQMDVAGRAATALAERGGNAEEAFEAVTTALVTGRTRGLAPFGIQIDETKDKASKFAEIMRHLGKVSGEVSESTLDASDKIGQQKVKFANIFDTVRDGIGKVAAEMLPLLEMLSSIGGAIGGSMGAIGKIAKYGIPVYGQVLLVKDAVSGNVMDIAKSYLTNAPADLMAAFAAGQALGGMGGLQVKPPGDIEMAPDFVGRVPRRKRGGSGDADAAARNQADEDSAMIQLKYEQDAEWQLERGVIGGMGGRGAAAGRGSDNFNLPSGAAGVDWASAQENIKLAGVLAQEALDSVRGPTLGEKLFGSVTEIDMYKESWGALTGAVGSGYDAMVDGSMSFGEAAKRSAADAIKAVGKKMLIRSLEETAEGFGSLARHDYPGAGNHFLSALKFGAGAAIAGYTANAMGTSGGSSGGASSRPSAPSSRGGSGSNTTTQGPAIIVYDDAFAENNAHERQLRAEKLVRRVVGSSAVRSN